MSGNYEVTLRLVSGSNDIVLDGFASLIDAQQWAVDAMRHSSSVYSFTVRDIAPERYTVRIWDVAGFDVYGVSGAVCGFAMNRASCWYTERGYHATGNAYLGVTTLYNGKDTLYMVCTQV